MPADEIITEVTELAIETAGSTGVVEIFTDPVGVFDVESPASPTSVIEVFTQPVVQIGVETAGPRGVKGDEGPQGPAGIPSQGAATRYAYPTPVYVWEGEHPYLYEPTVILLDPDGTKFYSTVRYPQPGLVVVTFAVPRAGTLVIRA